MVGSKMEADAEAFVRTFGGRSGSIVGVMVAVIGSALRVAV
jgi:hypothetical protein